MKITIKTVKKKLSFEVEIEPTFTVSQVKAKIEAEKPDGSFPQDRMTLIHAGKILADDKLVSDYTIKDGGFLVCMITKATSKPKPAATPAPAPVAAATPAPSIPATPAVATPAPATSAPASAATEVPSTPAPSIPAPAAAAPAASIGDESFNASVRDLMAMGFPEDQCAVALRAAFLDKNRAVEYLFNGIPDDVRAQFAAPVPAAAAVPAAATSAPILGAPVASDSTDPLSELRALPQFEAMRTRVRSDPTQLAIILREIGTSNPDVLAAINTNQAEFVRLMNEAPAAPVAPTGGMFGAPGAGAGAGAGALGGGMSGQALAQLMQSLGPEEQAALAQQIGMPPDQLQQFAQMISSLPPEVMSQLLSGAGGMGGADPPGVVRVELSTEEQAAVERLCALGFDRNRVLEAYLICDKNEEWTANYLFDNME